MRFVSKVSCVTMVLVGGAAIWSGEAAADFKDVKARGSLRVLVAANSAPGLQEEFCAPEGSADRGFDLEILGGFAALHRIRVEPIAIKTWNALVPALLDGKGDVVACGFSDTTDRRKIIGFTDEVFPTRTVVVTLGPTAAVSTAAELAQHLVGLRRGTSYADELLAAGVPSSRLVYLVDSGGGDAMIFPALRSGKISATVMGLENAIAARRRDPAVRVGMFLGQPGSLAFGVRKEDEELRAALSEYITNLKRTATWSRLVVKYFGEGAADLLKKVRTAGAAPN
jgi:ABC-type amino acid transport substrate-binding protein